jgi:hypothetical protein
MRQRAFAEQVPPLVEKPWQKQTRHPVVAVGELLR